MDSVICTRKISKCMKEEYFGRFRGGLLEYKTAEEFLVDIKKEFGGRDEEIVKVTELKRIEKRGKAMEEFVQEFKRAARRSGYKEKPLVEEFKREINGAIC